MIGSSGCENHLYFRTVSVELESVQSSLCCSSHGLLLLLNEKFKPNILL